MCERGSAPPWVQVHFTNALDLKPSNADSNTIKAAIDSLTALESPSDDESWGGRGS